MVLSGDICMIDGFQLNPCPIEPYPFYTRRPKVVPVFLNPSPSLLDIGLVPSLMVV